MKIKIKKPKSESELEFDELGFGMASVEQRMDRDVWTSCRDSQANLELVAMVTEKERTPRMMTIKEKVLIKKRMNSQPATTTDARTTIATRTMRRMMTSKEIRKTR